jgi:hypothetical protein
MKIPNGKNKNASDRPRINITKPFYLLLIVSQALALLWFLSKHLLYRFSAFEICISFFTIPTNNKDRKVIKIAR